MSQIQINPETLAPPFLEGCRICIFVFLHLCIFILIYIVLKSGPTCVNLSIFGSNMRWAGWLPAANNFSQYLICSWSQNVARVRQYRYLNISRIVQHFTNITKTPVTKFGLWYMSIFCKHFGIWEYLQIWSILQILHSILARVQTSPPKKLQQKVMFYPVFCFTLIVPQFLLFCNMKSC